MQKGYANREWETKCATELFDQLELCRGFVLNRNRATRLLQLIREQYGVDHEYCTMKGMKSILNGMIHEHYGAKIQKVKNDYIGIGYRGDIIAHEKKNRKQQNIVV